MDLDQLKALLDILMAAAAVDGHTDFRETNAIRDLLDELGELDAATRTELEGHQWAFDPETFSLEGAVRRLGHLDAEVRGTVIRLLEHVEEADGIIDFEEEEFIRRVALALGANEDEIEALTMQIVSSGPPPLPTA